MKTWFFESFKIFQDPLHRGWGWPFQGWQITRGCQNAALKQNIACVDRLCSSFLTEIQILDRRERRNPRHPEVGRARAPDISGAGKRIDNKGRRNRKGRRTKVFMDKGYLQATKVWTLPPWLASPHSYLLFYRSINAIRVAIGAVTVRWATGASDEKNDVSGVMNAGMNAGTGATILGTGATTEVTGTETGTETGTDVTTEETGTGATTGETGTGTTTGETGTGTTTGATTGATGTGMTNAEADGPVNTMVGVAGGVAEITTAMRRKNGPCLSSCRGLKMMWLHDEMRRREIHTLSLMHVKSSLTYLRTG